MSSRTLVGWSARAGMLGGLLWALFPVATVVVSLDETQFGTPSYLAATALYWLMAVVPLLLLLFALAGLHAAFGGAYGRLGNAGFLISYVALALMFVGNGVEVASLTFSGSESSLGHSLFLIGFLILLLGSVLLGVALARMRRDAASRLAGLLLALALPLGILLAVVLGTLAPETDLGFWAAITVPYGVAWTLLGYSLASRLADPPANRRASPHSPSARRRAGVAMTPAPRVSRSITRDVRCSDCVESEIGRQLTAMETEDQPTSNLRGNAWSRAAKPPASSGTLPGSLRGRRLVLARASWILVALVSVVGFAASVPAHYARALRYSGRNLHAPEAMKVGLERLGIPFEAYVFYWTAVLVLLAVVFFLVGAVIFWRRSDDPAALFFSITLVAFGAIWPNTLDALAGIHPLLDFAGESLSVFGFAAFFLMLYLFPDGRFVPRWTRWVALVFVAGLILNTFFPGSIFDSETWRAPFHLVEEAQGIAFIGTMIYAQVHRYRRVSTTVQRQQTKWVVFGLVVAVACFVGTANLEALPVFNRPGVPAALFGFFTSITYGFAFMIVPVAVGVAVLRHRLWDIDPIVNRVLVYGALTACVAGLYVFAVGYLGALFRVEDNLLVSLAATGLVAVLFAPLRDRLQRGVDRLLYGERDDPYAVLSRLGQRLEAALAPNAVLPAIVETVKEALKLPYAAIALDKGDGVKEIAASVGEPTVEPLRLPLAYQNEPVGELLLGPRGPDEAFGPADRRLLDGLARQAGVAVHAVRLTNDLQRSRERLVNTREEERRRLRRDLHDGLGPMLGSLPLKLDVAGDLIESDPAAARELLRGLKTQARSAVADIRRLVYALRPPALDDLGLLGAIRETVAQYGHNGLRASVEAPQSLPPLPAAVEVAAYRIVQEAVTNVSRHAGARSCAVRLSLDEPHGELRLEIEDDGRGIPAERGRGVGIASMHERAEELGGECVVEPSPGGGTRVYVSLPRTTPEQES